MSAVDIGRDAAHDAAQRELAQPIYPRASVIERLTGWFDDLLYRIQAEGSSIPGGWLTATVLIVLLLAALAVAVRIAMRASRSRRTVDAALFGTGGMTADQHRATAHGHAARGEWAPAIRHQMRAVARELEETAVLMPAMGRTATELGSDAGAAIPDLGDQFRRAANTFNDVAYGEQPGTEQGYRQIADLDEHLRARATTSAPTSPGSSLAAEWAEVR